MIRPLLALLLIATTAAAQPRSGYQDAGPQVRAMQDDDAANPGFLWVNQGLALWNERGCAGCHGAIATMRGVAARHPAWDAGLGRAVTLAQRIAHRGDIAPESETALALAAAIGLQSRGLPMAVAAEGPLAAIVAEGERLFRTRQGQLNLSCAQCHEERAGRRLGGATIPEGHANGYPEYRLEWQGMGSFARRLRACLIGVRAEPYPPGTPEAVALETFLAVRARALTVETPAVRP